MVTARLLFTLRELLCRPGSGHVYVMCGPFGGSWLDLPDDELL